MEHETTKQVPCIRQPSNRSPLRGVVLFSLVSQKGALRSYPSIQHSWPAGSRRGKPAGCPKHTTSMVLPALHIDTARCTNRACPHGNSINQSSCRTARGLTFSGPGKKLGSATGFELKSAQRTRFARLSDDRSPTAWPPLTRSAATPQSS